MALNNFTGKSTAGSLWVILGLGLFHGLGFASVMGHLPFRMVDLFKGVIGFNIGVELGQIAIVAVIFPLLFLLRRSSVLRACGASRRFSRHDRDCRLVVHPTSLRPGLMSGDRG